MNNDILIRRINQLIHEVFLDNSQFQIPQNSCIVFIEVDGLEECANITLISIAYNKDGLGEIVQFLDSKGNCERELLELSISNLNCFKSIITT